MIGSKSLLLYSWNLRLNLPLQGLAYSFCCINFNHFKNIFPLDCGNGQETISLCFLARQVSTLEDNAPVFPVCLWQEHNCCHWLFWGVHWKAIQTRGIANVRIHVEHVIGLLRWKFTILEGTLRTDYLISHHETLITTLHWWITWQEFVQLLLTSVLLLYHLIRQTSFETLEIEISLSSSPLEESDEEQYLVRVVAE